MKNNHRIKVKIMKFASILFISLSILLVMFFTFEGKIREFVYKVNPNTVNLVRVSIYAVEHHDLEMMMKYLPLAIDSPDFVEAVNENKLFISRNVQFKENAMKAEFTYYAFVLELAFTYLKEYKYENHDELATRFINAQYPDFVDIGFSYYINRLHRYKLNDNECKKFLEVLNRNTPELIDLKVENEEIIYLNIYSLLINQVTYNYLSDYEEASKYHERSSKLAIEYNKIKEGK